jgi:hypothetical protein
VATKTQASQIQRDTLRRSQAASYQGKPKTKNAFATWIQQILRNKNAKAKKLLETQNAAQMRLQGADLSEQSDQRTSSNGNSFLM